MLRPENSTLAGALWPQDGHAVLRNVALIVIGSLILTLSAKIKVPLEPVPVTMQPLAVIGLSLALGSRLAVATVLCYLAQGLAGLPVFTGTPEKGLGMAYMIGPTGGFLAGFLVAAWSCGWLADRGWSRHFGLATLAGFVGLGMIYLPGTAWLAALIGFDKAVAFGIAPFILKDLVGAVIAGLAVPSLWRLMRR